MTVESKDPDRRYFERLGIVDPAAPDADDHLRLLRYLVAHGATEADLLGARKQHLGHPRHASTTVREEFPS